MKAKGAIIPCHRPSQKPAGSCDAQSATSTLVALQALNTNRRSAIAKMSQMDFFMMV